MCEHPFNDEPMFTTEPTVPSARILSLDSKMDPSDIQRMLNKDFTRFHAKSFSKTPKSSRRKKGGSTGRVTERVRVRR